MLKDTLPTILHHTINDLQMQVLPHEAYSPDIVPCDFYRFRPLQKLLGRKTQNESEVQ